MKVRSDLYGITILQNPAVFALYWRALLPVFFKATTIRVRSLYIVSWPQFHGIRVSSYEPGQLGWLGFRDLASRLFSLSKHRCVHLRGRAGSVFATEISVTGVKIFPYEHSSPVTGTPNIFDKIPSLSPDSGQNGMILLLYVFPLQGSMQNSFINKVIQGSTMFWQSQIV